ncbi:MAG: PDZ domain-containing protein [Bacteroidales bacterium]|nr:PDZ domain-containing protein [Bacteroidales bacterium]
MTRLKAGLVLLVSLMAVSATAQNPTFQLNNNKMNYLLRAVNDMYVDTVNFEKLVEKGVVEILTELDPHSIYIPKKDVQQTNEPLQGAFDGIGVTFQLIKDTINVLEVIVGGPSEKVGLRPGDKIVKVDSSIACGKSINNKWVQTHLRGKKGTKVKVWVKRGQSKNLLEFTITRDKIPMNSINVYFMVDKNTGYIRLERFAATSPKEFSDALAALKKQGMKHLIFDLRGNSGGYLDVAFKIADEFIKKDRVIVYTDNRRHDGQKFYSTDKGDFEKGNLVVLVDEGSASASEIVSGAIQDWDRGLIVGRRTFGKGLVQKPMYLPDRSMIRLTISRYYTPTGRCIQKPYDDNDSYSQELNNRYKHGEYLTADSISFPDSLKFTTPRGKVVYGGGGIMPDIFIPIDTTKYSTLYSELLRKGIFGEFAMQYLESHRNAMKLQYPDVEAFKDNFDVSDSLYAALMTYARKEGVKDTVTFNFSKRLEFFAKKESKKLDSLYRSMEDMKDTEALNTMLADYLKKSMNESQRLRNVEHSPEFIKDYLKYELARYLYSWSDAARILLQQDDAFKHACDVIKDDKVFKKFKVD